jgi:hypothetical protein
MSLRTVGRRVWAGHPRFLGALKRVNPMGTWPKWPAGSMRRMASGPEVERGCLQFHPKWPWMRMDWVSQVKYERSERLTG